MANRRASLLIPALVILTLLGAVGVAALNISVSNSRLGARDIRKQEIFQVAEAGINYYRWFLAHYPNDYQDGTGIPGPYVHDFKDSSGTIIGRYDLVITPPTSGSTIATIQSSGYLLSHPNVKKTLVARVGIPSWSQYAVVAHAALRFGQGTETFGPIHSNGGIRFDGLAHGLVTSFQTSYDDPDGDDCNGGNSFGVHTCVAQADPSPPAAVPDRPDIFAGGRQFPVAPVDFDAITVNLADLDLEATAGGISLPPSGARGYHLTLKTNDQIDMRIVNIELTCQYRSGAQWRDYGYCSNDFNDLCNNDSGCSVGETCILSSHGVGNRVGDESTFVYQGGSSLNVPLPANGVIFARDNVWVDGTVDGARVTIVAAEDPLSTGDADIYINNDIAYTHTDGQDAIGLIAQNNVLAGFFSEDDIRIDAALLAQNGRTGRAFYGSSFTSTTSSANFRVQPAGSTLPNGGAGENDCGDFRRRSTLTSYGSLGTYQRYGFAWVGSLFSCPGGLSNNSGYCIRNLNFDPYLTFAPPPHFPTTGSYQVISFDEIDP